MNDPHSASGLRTRSRSPEGVIVALSLCMALQMTSFVIPLPLFALRLEALGAGVKALGISAMAFALTSTLAAPFMGALADRLGRRYLMLVSLAAYVAAYTGYLLAPSAAVFIGVRGLAGAFTAGLMPAVTGLAADLAPGHRVARWLGFMSAGSSLGWAVGPVAGGLIFDRWGYAAALGVTIAMAAAAYLVALLAIPDVRTARPVPAATQGVGQAPGRREPLLRRVGLSSSLIVLLLLFFAAMFGWAFIEPPFMFHAYNDLEWSSSQLGLVMSTYAVAMFLGGMTLGGLSDRLGRKPVIIVGMVLYSAQFFGLATFRSAVPIVAAFVVAGLGNALFDPTLSASVLEHSPAEHRTSILGIKSMVGSAGTILGSALISMLSTTLEARSAFLIAGAAVLLVTAVGVSGRERRTPSHST